MHVPAAPRYRGRFAPSPTGPLHFGSVVAALGSFLEARSRGGEWLVRIEDIDPPRERPDAADAILEALEALGLVWDGEVVYQSRRREAHETAIATLEAHGLAYACGCTRREIGAGPYGGRCRDGVAPGRRRRSLRVLTDARPVTFCDRLHGPQRVRLDRTSGDFVVRRADGLIAYHLAVTVDDAWQGVTEIVRGADLLAATAPQVHLQRLLGLPRPAYAHLPVAVDAHGRKLSKQNRAPAVDPRQASQTLAAALAFLDHPPPAALAGAPPAELLAWAANAWRLERVAPRATRAAPAA